MLAQPPIWLIIVAFVAAIGPLVFFHELGHYLVGRLFGVGAQIFSIGFGHEVVGWTDKQGTRWKIGWLPLGGYVRFIGDMNAASAPGDVEELPPGLRKRSFPAKPVWQRFLIVLAGPAANYLLAILIFAGFFAAFGMPSTPSLVAGVQQGSAAATAGIRAGDRIETVNGENASSFEDLERIVALRPGEIVSITVDRNGQRKQLQAKLGTTIERDRFGQGYRIGRLGVFATGEQLKGVPPLELIPQATRYTYVLTAATVEGIGQIISGRRSADETAGPLKIAQIAGQQAALGPLEFVQFLALLSINLGFINLLPVPVLDGGHLFFYILEAVRRRPVSVRIQEWAFRGGLALLLTLLLLRTVGDLGSFGLWDRLGRLIG
jgi:regulator of sigma E protease